MPTFAARNTLMSGFKLPPPPPPLGAPSIPRFASSLLRCAARHGRRRDRGEKALDALHEQRRLLHDALGEKGLIERGLGPFFHARGAGVFRGGPAPALDG